MSAIATNDNGTAAYRYKFEGSKYRATEKLSRVEVAKMIREDIKAAQKSGELPRGMKVSVRCPGGSIDIVVMSAPFEVCSDEARASWLKSSHDFVPVYRTRSAEATRVLEILEDIHASYNFDNSEIMTDYFHVRYYGGAKLAWQIEAAERAAYVAHFGEVR